MKPIYKSLVLSAVTLQVSVSLQAQVTDGESTTQTPIPAEVLDSLRVELVAPNVSGARDLIKSGECTVSDNELSIELQTDEWLKGGVYRLQVSATFGTQTQVIYTLDVTVPRYDALESDPQEYEDTVTVVSTYGDGDKSGADATVYAKDEDGNAHITTPMSVGDGVATSAGAVASGSAGDGASIQATSAGAVASGYAGEGSSIQADSAGAVASGSVDGDGAGIQATGDGAVASGSVDGDGAGIQARSDGAVASGHAYGEGASIQATGEGAVASGSAVEGASIQAAGDGAVASGHAYGEGASIQATGEGAVASGSAGNGASIQATSEGAVASGYAGNGASIQADSAGAIVAGVANDTYGNVEAQGEGSQAFGLGTQAAQDAQMVCGQCNVVDEDDTFQFIVGNGADGEHRSNAFAITKSGELALFEADGTPVILTAADLKALIAMV